MGANNHKIYISKSSYKNEPKIPKLRLKLNSDVGVIYTLGCIHVLDDIIEIIFPIVLINMSYIVDFVLVICMFIGIIIFGDHYDEEDLFAFPFTVYTVGGACGAVGAVFMLLEMWC